MKSRRPCSTPNIKDRVLPPDLLFEVLLRLPAKTLCSLRTVCRTWQSLLSDPLFIAAHTSRHPEPLLVTLTGDHNINILDSSGNVIIRRIAALGGPNDSRFRWYNHNHMFNPATETISILPHYSGEEYMPSHMRSSDFFGQVAATGEYKVLHIVEIRPLQGSLQQLCKIFTLGSNHRRWREKRSPMVHINLRDMCNVVVESVVYFLLASTINNGGVNGGDKPGYIASFDLETEEWRELLQGPLRKEANNLNNHHDTELRLAELKGHLVTIHHHRNIQDPSIDLWFLMDFNKGTWVKEYKILLAWNTCRPLLASDNGEIVIWLEPLKSLCTYDTRTHAFTNIVEIHDCHAIGTYTQSLLSLEGDKRSAVFHR